MRKIIIKKIDYPKIYNENLQTIAVSGAAFFTLMILYIFTIPIGIIGGDAGELAAAACSSGVAHPPGYPLWTLLAKWALVWPGPSPAWQLGFLGSFMSASAAALFVPLMRCCGGSYTAGCTTALLFGSASTVWFFTITPEVFALNSLLVMLGMYIVIKASEGGRKKAPPLHTVSLFGLVFGFAISNHQTGAAILLPLIGYLFWQSFQANHSCFLKQIKFVFSLGVGVALGLTPYLYLPWVGHNHSSYSWGDTSTWHGLLNIFFRDDYGTLQLVAADRNPNYWGNINTFLKMILDESHGAAPFLACLGLWAFKNPSRYYPRLLISIPICSATIFVLAFSSRANLIIENVLHQQVLSRFWILPFMFVMFLSGICLDYLLDITKRHLGSGIRRIILGLGVFGIMTGIYHNFRFNNLRNENRFEEFMRAELEGLPAGALLLVRGDLILPLNYLQACLKIRPDVYIINRLSLQKA